MIGPYPETPEEAIQLLLGEDPDLPKDCHRHCEHWATEGECCECGDVRTPNHNYQPSVVGGVSGLEEYS